MLKKITLGHRSYGFAVGPKGFIVSNNEFIHGIYELDQVAPLNTGKPFEPKYEQFTLADLSAADSAPLSMREWGHYWGIKPRMAGNYALLLKSMREVGLDTFRYAEVGRR